jgi:hypothetical protein
MHGLELLLLEWPHCDEAEAGLSFRCGELGLLLPDCMADAGRDGNAEAEAGREGNAEAEAGRTRKAEDGLNGRCTEEGPLCSSILLSMPVSRQPAAELLLCIS